MNYKRCAFRNNLKERAIRILAGGIDIEVFSNLLENDEGKSFLNNVADALEKKIETLHGKIDYDSLTIEELFNIGMRAIEIADIKNILSRTILILAKTGDTTIKMDASQKWITAKSTIDTEVARYELYVFSDIEFNAMILDAFIMMIIEETNKDTAGRIAVTKACKKKGVDKEQYANWLE